jgi:aspartate dehydrogenase
MAVLRLALAGLGAVGFKVALEVDAGRIEGMALSAIAVRDAEKAQAKLARFRSPPPVVPLDELAATADVIVECLPARLFLAVAEPALRRGRIFMPLSVGALLGHMELIDLARETGARIVVPSGAILGLDAVKAVAEGPVDSIRIVTRKPPGGLEGAPYLVDNAISVAELKEPVRVFAGSAREAARAFPANLNVSVALSLAGIGPDRTEVEVWADPALTRNTHTVHVRSATADLTMSIAGVPSVENPRTGIITPLSVIAALRRLTAPLIVGT